jgi:hypothetical protein
MKRTLILAVGSGLFASVAFAHTPPAGAPSAQNFVNQDRRQRHVRDPVEPPRSPSRRTLIQSRSRKRWSRITRKLRANRKRWWDAVALFEAYAKAGDNAELKDLGGEDAPHLKEPSAWRKSSKVPVHRHPARAWASARTAWIRARAAGVRPLWGPAAQRCKRAELPRGLP